MSSEKYHPALDSLSWLFGVWETVEAEVFYPTIETVQYKEIMEYLPAVGPEPILEYKSETWHSAKKTKLHCERGFLKIDPESKKLALLVSHMFGLNEISEGSFENESLCLESQLLSTPSFYKCVEVVKVVRKISLKGDELHLTMDMQTGNQPLQPHLRSIFRKKA